MYRHMFIRNSYYPHAASCEHICTCTYTCICKCLCIFMCLCLCAYICICTKGIALTHMPLVASSSVSGACFRMRRRDESVPTATFWQDRGLAGSSLVPRAPATESSQPPCLVFVSCKGSVPVGRLRHVPVSVL